MPELLNATAGTGHDQLDVTGTVSLGGATLETHLLAGFNVATGTPLVIIKNDGTDAVTGTFAGLAEGANFGVGGKTLRISYTGGTGNDVTLTPVTLGTGVTRTWDGGGADNNWNTPANWVDLPGNPPSVPAAGDDLVFPAGAAKPSNNNNIAAGRVFNSITVQAAGYILAGNTVLLNTGMNFEQASGLTTISLPVTLTQAQSFTVTAGGGPQFTGAGAITNAGFPLTVQTAAGGALLLTGFSGTGALVKTGPGAMSFGISNPFTGAVNVAAGTATVAAPVAGAGAGTAPIIVMPGATLNFSSTNGTLTKPVVLGGRLAFSNTSVTLSGAITLGPGNDGIVDPLPTSSPVLSGVISGVGRLEKRGPGTVNLTGAAANTFTGGTTVTEGTLRLQKSAGITALPGPVAIGDGAGTDVLLLAAANQIGNAAPVSLTGNGASLQMGSFADTVGALRFTGGSVNGEGPLTPLSITSLAAATTALIEAELGIGGEGYTISVEDGAAAVDLQVDGALNGSASLALTRTGPGTLLLAGGDAGSLDLRGGLTKIFRDWNGMDIVLNGGTLGGEATTGPVASESGGGIAPGSSPGILATGALNGNERTTMTFEIGGAVAGTGYDQIAVTGPVDLQGTVLEVVWLPGFAPLPGQSFTLVANDSGDEITGTFFRMEESTEVIVGPVTGFISYKGGDGNDITLTVVRYTDTGVTRVWDGGGADNKWTTAANWRDDIAPQPGDSLEFPAGAAQLGTLNDFPAGTNFERVRFTGGGYTAGGARVALNSGLDSAVASGATAWTAPITLTQPQTFGAAGGVLTFTATALLDNGGHTLTCDADGGAFDMLSVISGGGGLTKTGLSNLNLFAANTFGGTVNILEGRVAVFSNTALGGGASVQTAGTLVLGTVTGLVIAAPLTVRGTVTSSSGPHRLNGAVSVPAAAVARFDVVSHRLDLAGRVQGGGAVLKREAGTLGLLGTLSNTFSGGLTVAGGDVILQKTVGVVALPGPVAIGDGSPGSPARRVVLAAANQIPDTATVRLAAGDAVLDLAGFAETLTGLDMTGGAVTSGAGTLTLTGNVITQPAETPAVISGNLALGGAGLRGWTVAAGGADADLEIAAALTAPGGAVLHKLGEGTLAFSGSGPGLVHVQGDAGRLRFLGIQPLLDIEMNGATAEGAGTLGTLNSLGGGGIISPGLSPGRLTPENVIANAATTLRFELNGTTPGTEYDQLMTVASNSLGGAALDVQLGFTPAVGDSFMLIENTNSIATLTGTFAGLPQLGHFSRPGGIVFRINYAGGDGNDLVISRVDVPAPEITGWSVTPGTGPNAGSDVVDVEVTGTAGLTYLLESSSDLLNWTTADSETAGADGSLAFQVIEPGVVGRVFYRARLP